MSTQLSRLSFGAAATALYIALAATPAYAGFQWVSPSDAQTYAAPAPTSYDYAPSRANSVATTAPEIISPVVISGDVKAPPSAPSYADTMPIVPPQPAAMPKDLSTATISVSPPPTDSHAVANDVVQGFASQVPLALALRQILPVGYSFSIDAGVEMDTLVSYKGGRSWRDTVHAMLIPAGLVEREQGNTIIVTRASAAGENKALVQSPTSVPSLQPTKQPQSLGYLTMPAPQSRISAASMDVPSTDVSLPDGWAASRGDTLRKVLTNWCRRANIELQWKAEYDYPIEASAHFSGGFEDAVRNLLAGFDGARPQPVGELYKNSAAGQVVLVIQARGNSYSN